MLVVRLVRCRNWGIIILDGSGPNATVLELDLMLGKEYL
jgi:hypothetical protein